MRLALRHQVIRDHVGREGDDGDTKAGEGAGEHLTAGEDGMAAPGLAFCPRVAEELRVAGRRHLEGGE